MLATQVRPGNIKTMQIHGDRPIQRRDEDWLGFAAIAERIARALINRSFSGGLVVGIEGAWGSGKSSLMQLMRSELEYADTNSRPALVTFSPWLIGDRDAMLRTFFEDLAKTMERFEANPATAKPTEGLSDRIRQYAKRLDKAAPVISTLIGLLNSKAGELAETAFETMANATEGELPLEELKDEIAGMLRALPNRVVVVIDDLDRLEPSEIGEIVRLVRSVADFENVVYVLCYDQDILARAIEKALHVENGHAFMEKIIQVSFPVPAPEPFALRRMLQDRLTEIRWEGEDRDTATTDTPSTEEGRLSAMIDASADRLPTPRHVNRVVDAVSVRWSSLRGQIDFSDLVFLQIIRLSNRRLYKWIEKYVATYAVVEHQNAHFPEERKKRIFQELTETLAEEGSIFEEEQHKLDDLIPGIDTAVGAFNEDAIGIFAPMPTANIPKFEAEKRLASPTHHRLYFAWNRPSGAVGDTDIAEFMGLAAQSDYHAAPKLQVLMTESHAGVGSRGEQLLERLERYEFQAFEAQPCAIIIDALANTMDAPIQPMAQRPWGGWTHWRLATRLLPRLKACAAEFADDAIERAFRDGTSIGWLTDVLRRETFAHGLYGDRPRDPKDWILTEVELTKVISLLHRRYAEFDLEQLRWTPEPASILFAWSQSGGASDARRFVQDVTQEAEGLVGLVECFVSVVESSGGNYYRLQNEGLSGLLDLDRALERLRKIEADLTMLSDRATQILGARENDLRH